MPKEFKNTFKSIIIYGFGNVSVKLVGLVLLPLYTDIKLLSPNDYGAMAIIDVTAQILIAIFSLSLYAAYARWYWDKNYFDSRKRIFFSCFSTLTVLAVLAFCNRDICSRANFLPCF